MDYFLKRSADDGVIAMSVDDDEAGEWRLQKLNIIGTSARTPFLRRTTALWGSILLLTAFLTSHPTSTLWILYPYTRLACDGRSFGGAETDSHVASFKN